MTSTSITMASPLPYLRGFGIPGTLVGSVRVGNSPFGIAFDSENGNLYVPNVGSDNMSVISAATNTVVATFPVGNAPFGVAFDSWNGQLYVTDCGSNCDIGPGNITVVDGSTNHVVDAIPAGVTPINLVFDSANGNLYVANLYDNTVTVISGTTDAVVATIGVGQYPNALAYNNANDNVYVTNSRSCSVSVISGATNMVVTNITVACSPTAVAYDSANGNLYVASQFENNMGANDVTVISGTTNKVLGTIAVDLSPSGIAYDSANGYLYVTQQISDTLTVISDSTNATLATIPVGKGYNFQPYGVVYDSQNGNVYVVNSHDDTVSVISTLASAMVPVSATLDVGESLLMSASVLNQGAWTIRTDISVSPSMGLSCRPDPLGFGSMSGACQGVLPGDYDVTFTATDSLGNSTERTLSITVFSLPQVRLTVTPSEISQGMDVVFNATVAGGAGGFLYSWDGLPVGCATPAGPTVTCAPWDVGAFNVTVTVWDANNVADSGNATLTVHSGLLGLPAAQGYAIMGGIAAVILVVAAVALVYLRRKKRGRDAISPADESEFPRTPPR